MTPQHPQANQNVPYAHPYHPQHQHVQYMNQAAQHMQNMYYQQHSQAANTVPPVGCHPTVTIHPDDKLPKSITCLFCNAQVTTEVSKKLKVCFTILSFMVSPFLAIILFLLGALRYNIHKCPNCQAVVSESPVTECWKRPQRIAERENIVQNEPAQQNTQIPAQPARYY